MTHYAVDLDELESVIDRMSTCQRDLCDLLADVEVETSRIHDGWAGLARDAHVAAYRSWLRDVDEMSAALDELREVADAAHGNYHRAVGANTTMWGQLL